MNIWEDHVEGLTRQVALMKEQMEVMEQRLDYYEQVLGTLLYALKTAGIIVDDPDGEHTMPS
tara:strand:- start:919 stop:1104 length:186 start_codon:yes stop_codon:yes gene_type:complete